MPTNKFYHILCTTGDKVVYEGRFQCVSRSAAMKLLREKVGRQNLLWLNLHSDGNPDRGFKGDS